MVTMMAARSISQTLIRVSSSSSSSSSNPLKLFAPNSSSSTTLLKCRHHHPRPYYRLIARRHQSSSSHDNPSQVLVLDVDLNHADADAQALAVQKIEDAIHRIVVRRSAPDWLPFLPGSSFWVPPPPPRRHGIAQFVHKLANPLSDEEAMSLATLRGWPSSSFYLHHDTSSKLAESEVAMSSTELSQVEDEEG